MFSRGNKLELHEMLLLSWCYKVVIYWHTKMKAESFKIYQMGFKDPYNLKQGR